MAGAGFIGSNFIFYMEKTHPGDRIICLDKLTYAGNLSTLSPLAENENFRFVRLFLRAFTIISGISFSGNW